MEIIEIVVQNPYASGLIVAMGGLAFQQYQIRALNKRVDDCADERIRFLEDRQDRMWESLESIRLALMRKTDLKE